MRQGVRRASPSFLSLQAAQNLFANYAAIESLYGRTSTASRPRKTLWSDALSCVNIQLVVVARHARHIRMQCSVFIPETETKGRTVGQQALTVHSKIRIDCNLPQFAFGKRCAYRFPLCQGGFPDNFSYQYLTSSPAYIRRRHQYNKLHLTNDEMMVLGYSYSYGRSCPLHSPHQ